jgi:glycopeptide antibiotics resistance protein
MIREAFIDIIAARWLSIFIALIITSIIRVIYLGINKRKLIFYKEILYAVFVVYVICLFYVVTFEDVSWSTYNLTPFKEMFRYKLGSNPFIKNVIGNLIMFVPLGFFCGYILKIKKARWTLLLSTLMSLIIETIQSKIGRVFDIDDIILNIMGGVIGYYIYYLLSIIQKRLPNFMNKDLISNIITFITIILFLMYLGGLYE